MPRVKWGISTDEPDDLQQFDIYEGDDPVRGVYDGVIQRLTKVTNNSGDDMLKILWKIAEPKDSPKAKYNGWVSWENQNVTDVGGPFLKQFLKALGLTWSEFVNKTVTAQDDPEKIIRIGNVKFNDGNEPACRANIGMGKRSADGQYPARMQVKNWMPPKENEDWDGADDEPEDEDDPFK